MNDPRYAKKGGHFFNGFFWGAVIGGGFAYLLSTKRGRDLLKELTQDGIDMLDNATTPENAEIVSEPEVYEEIVEEASQESPKVIPQDSAERRKEPSKKRFFRKIRTQA